MALQRKGTIIKHDELVHAQSYALKDIQVQYKPPVSGGQSTFALPVGWRKPEMPPAAKFKYDYSVENQIVEQAQVKALSLARKVTQEELQKPRLPHLDSTILTPMPVSSAPSTTPTSTTTTADQSVTNMAASLGEMSLRDFEGDSGDPFEATSLQAINDMELLQTVLISHHAPQPLLAQLRGSQVAPQPLGPPQPLVQLQGAGTPLQSNLAQAIKVTQPQPNIVAAQPTAYGSPATPLVLPPIKQLPHPRRASSSEDTVPSMSSGPIGGVPQGPIAGIGPQGPMAGIAPQGPMAGIVPQGPMAGIAPQGPMAGIAPQGPMAGIAPQGPMAGIGPQGPMAGIAPQGSIAGIAHQGPVGGVVRGVGGVFQNRESEGVSQTTPSCDLAAPSLAPPVVSTRQTSPLGPILPASPSVGLPPPSAGPPPLLPKPTRPIHVGNVITTTSSPSPSNHNTVALPPAQVLVHDGMNLVPSTAAPSKFGRPGLGVPVLPPIGVPRPLPPYGSSPVVAPLPLVQPPPPASFRLVDPRSSLTPEQKVELDSLTAMGFPPPRVARALLRCGDKSKALDFLVQIGNLEEKGYYGDSAEQALVSTQNEDEALNYLGKVEQYKGIGFPEGLIHEAYTKADGNWDNALDRLTQGGV